MRVHPKKKSLDGLFPWKSRIYNTIMVENQFLNYNPFKKLSHRATPKSSHGWFPWVPWDDCQVKKLGPGGWTAKVCHAPVRGVPWGRAVSWKK